MKLIINLLLVLFIFKASSGNNFTEVRKGILSAYLTECLCSSGADPAFVPNYLKNGVLVNDPCFKCFLKCLAVKVGFLDSTGSFDESFVVRKYGVPLQSVHNCNLQAENITDLCQKTYVSGICFLGLIYP